MIMYEPRPYSRRAIRLVIGVLVIAILLVILVSLLLYEPWNNGFPMMGHIGFWLIGLLIFVIIIGFILRLLFWAAFGHPGGRYMRWERRYGPWSGGDAESILDQRYARGEISLEQYRQMREELRRGHL